MKKCVYWLLVVFVVVMIHSFALADTLTEDQEEELQEKIKSLGISQYEMDINVRIPIPDITRYEADGTPEVMPGVDLWAILLKPAGDERRPTIVIPTAYRRDIFLSFSASLVKKEYNLLAVDIRGSGSSGGEWLAFDFPEHYDMAYVVDKWIPEQSWSNGDVGMIGPSYLGITQYMASGHIEVDENGDPVHLKALVPIVAGLDAYKDIIMHGGNVDVEFVLFWLGITDVLSLLPPLQFLGEDGLPGLNDFQEAIDIWITHLQALSSQFGWIMDYDTSYDGDFHNHRSSMIYWPIKPDPNDPYGGWGFPEGGKSIPSTLPALTTGGWYCIFIRGVMNNFQYGLVNHDAADKALIVGPWFHLDAYMTLGIEGFMFNNAIPGRWFDWKLKGIEDPFMVAFPVMLYAMGEERWRAEKSWPLPESRTCDRTFYLSKKKPSDIDGDWFSTWNAIKNFTLTETLSDDDLEGDDPILVHNPPLFHGLKSKSFVKWIMGFPAFPSQASKLMAGKDIDEKMPWEDERVDEVGALTFTTEPLEEDLEIVGPLSLTFWAKTEFHRPLTQNIVDYSIEAIKTFCDIDDNLILDTINQKDVQWVVALNDVFENGRAKNIATGWLNSSHRPYDPEDPTQLDPDYTVFDPFYDYPDLYPMPIEEEVVYPYVVEIWPTDNVFKAGHRIRVSISGSDFPHLLPVLHPSRNTLVIDETHQPRLDFKSITSEGEGETWKWINAEDSDGDIKTEFSVFNDYLLTHQDSIESVVTDDETDETHSADASETDRQAGTSSSSSGDSGGCFINVFFPMNR